MSRKKTAVSSGKDSNGKTIIIVAVMGLLGTITAAFFGFLASVKPTEISISATQTAEAKLTPPPVPTPYSGIIPFASSPNTNLLNTELQWDAGDSALSLYTLSANTIYLTAGPHTWPNFPVIYYKQPIAGNFDVHVKVTFKSPVTVLDTAQMVGLAIRPINSHLSMEVSSFPMDWVVTAKYITAEGSLVGCRGSWPEYSLDTVYLKIERDNDIWRCAYSENGKNWIWLSAKADIQSLSNKQLEVALFAYSITDDSITAEFSDWFITRK